MGQGGIRGHTGQRALELANVVEHVGGDELQHLGGHAGGCELGILAEDCETGLDVRRLNVGQEPPLEAASQPVFERRQMLRGAVGADPPKRRPPAAPPLEELNVVEKQDVDGAIPRFELVHPLAPDPVDELVEELLGGDISHDGPGKDLSPVMTHGMEEVGFAQTGLPVDEERVVVTARLFGDGIAECRPTGSCYPATPGPRRGRSRPHRVQRRVRSRRPPRKPRRPLR